MTTETNKGFWLKFYQSFTEWHWYRDVTVKALYIHCLLKAYVKPQKIGSQIIPRGSFVTSSIRLADELGLTRQQIRTAISKLISTNDITTKSTNKKTIINVVNYTFYQGEPPNSNQQNNQQPNHQITSKQPANNQQITTDIECIYSKKEERKKEKDLSNTSITREISKPISPNYEEIMSYWNDYSELKPIVRLTDKRKGLINSRLKEYGIDKIKQMIDTIPQSPFLKGENNRSWTADFDWCFRPNNFVKVLEGKYQTNNIVHNKKSEIEKTVENLDKFFPEWE